MIVAENNWVLNELNLQEASPQEQDPHQISLLKLG